MKMTLPTLYYRNLYNFRSILSCENFNLEENYAKNIDSFTNLNELVCNINRAVDKKVLITREHGKTNIDRISINLLDNLQLESVKKDMKSKRKLNLGNLNPVRKICRKNEIKDNKVLMLKDKEISHSKRKLVKHIVYRSTVILKNKEKMQMTEKIDEKEVKFTIFIRKQFRRKIKRIYTKRKRKKIKF